MTARIGVVRLAGLITGLVYAFVVLALIILALGFLLLLFGANPEADFADWVYRALDRVMAPFRGLFEDVRLTDESVLDISLLFAMVVYGIVALLLASLIDWLRRRLVGLEQRAWRERETDPGRPADDPASRS